MTDAEAIARASQAARAWGGATDAPILIRNRENIVLKATLKAGQTAAIRLHRKDYQTLDAIQSELNWTAALSKAGFPCPAPLPREDGDLTFLFEDGQVCSVISWINAEQIGANGVAFDGTPNAQLHLYERIGRLIADLHQTTDRLDLSEMVRPNWSIDGFVGRDPLWGHFWRNPALTSKEVEILQRARKNAAQHLERLSDPQIGLIHADVLQENILQTDRLWLIDFDDSGYGFRDYDLGTALIQHAESPHLDELEAALLSGYAAPQDDLSLWIMLRSMASCGWIISRADHDDPRQRFYAERALRCVARYERKN